MTANKPHVVVAFVLWIFALTHGNEGIDSDKFVSSFRGPESTILLDMGCKINDDTPVCCGVLRPLHHHRQVNSSSASPLLVSSSSVTPAATVPTSPVCVETREYIPSPYEQAQLDKAKAFDNMPDFDARRAAIVAHITSDEDILDSVKWLGRVKWHMQQVQFSDRIHPHQHHHHHAQHIHNISEAAGQQDMHYLSRFRVTKKCKGSGDEGRTWSEWIEPLSLHARHPFSLLNLVGINITALALRHPKYSSLINSTAIQNSDYVLLSNAHNLRRRHRSGKGRVRLSEHVSSGSSTANSNISNVTEQVAGTGPLVGGDVKYYFFDGGTSTFKSSLWWFLCMYLQQGIAFDQMFGWEQSLLDPVAFWKEVPAPIKERYHFYNTGLSQELSSGDSPLRMIKGIATEEDFVSFKLDIDTPEVEIPTVLSILNDSSLHGLIDEFFFELHFRCELLMSDGWGNRIPHESHGLTLFRWNAMKLFQDLRNLGVRSHFWP
jgi:hypothetical protein